MMRHYVQIGFFKYGSCLQRFGHVELRFSDGHVTSITRDPGVVHYDCDRILSNSNYSSFFEIDLTEQEESLMQQLAKWHHDQETPFGHVRMYFNFLCKCCPVRGPKRLFCSQYIVMLLQNANMLMDLDPDTTSPDALYGALKDFDRAYFAGNNRRSRANLIIKI